MANYRLIHTQIWRDSWFMDLTPTERYFFIYLFSNDAASVCGLYRLDLRVIEFETGLSREEITALFDKFERDGKAYYRDGVIWVVNLQRYNASTSPKVSARIKTDLAGIPTDHPLRIAYDARVANTPYRIDTVSVLQNEKTEISPVSVSVSVSVDDTAADTVSADRAQSAPQPPPQPSNDLAPVYSAYQNVFGMISSQAVADDLADLVKDMAGVGGRSGAECVLAAIEEAKNSSKGLPSLKYLKSILARWKREGGPSARASPGNGDGRMSREEIARHLKAFGVKR